MSNNYLKTKKFRDFDLRKSDGTYEIQTGELHENTDVAQDVFLVGYRVGENDVNGSNSREFKIKLESLEPQTKWDDLQFHIVKTTNEEESTIYTLYYNTVGETTFQSEYEDENPWKAVTDFIEIPKSDENSNFNVTSYRTDFYQPTENFNVELFDPNEGISEEALIPYTDSFEERNTDLLALVTMLDENDNTVGYFWYYVPYTKPIGNYISDITWESDPNYGGGGVITYTTTNSVTDEVTEITIPNNQQLNYQNGWLTITGIGGNSIQIPGGNGEPGVGVVSILKTSTSGLVDTYTITYTDGNTDTFTVTNGRDGVDGADSTVPGPQGPQGEQGPQGIPGIDGADGRGIYAFTGPVTIGNVSTYTLTYTDGTTSNITVQNGQNGRGISSITGPIRNGYTDTYTINYTDSTTQTYYVINGVNGTNAPMPQLVITEVTGGHQLTFNNVTTPNNNQDPNTFNVMDGATGPAGPAGADGEDGTSFSLFRLTVSQDGQWNNDLIFEDATSEAQYYVLNNSSKTTFTVEKYDTFNLQYVPAVMQDLQTAITNGGNNIVDICPDTEDPMNVATNMTYGAFGLYDADSTTAPYNIDGFTFYSVKDPVTLSGTKTLVFTVKVYANIH